MFYGNNDGGYFLLLLLAPLATVVSLVITAINLITLPVRLFTGGLGIANLSEGLLL